MRKIRCDKCLEEFDRADMVESFSDHWNPYNEQHSTVTHFYCFKCGDFRPMRLSKTGEERVLWWGMLTVGKDKFLEYTREEWLKDAFDQTANHYKGMDVDPFVINGFETLSGNDEHLKMSSSDFIYGEGYEG